MEIVYRAFDGKEFEEEEQCEAYERIKTTPKECMGFKLYDTDGSEVKLLDEEYRVNDDFYYIITHNTEESATLYDILHDAGISSPWDNHGWKNCSERFEAGQYYYDCEDCRWKNFEDFEETYNHMLSIFNQDKGK